MGSDGSIVDFDFCINLKAVPNGPNGPVVQWSVAGDEPAYRGRMVREFEGSTVNGPRNLKAG